MFHVEIRTGLYWSTWCRYANFSDAERRLLDFQKHAEDPQNFRIIFKGE